MNRQDIEDKYKWDLTHLYKDNEKWKTHKDTFKQQFESIVKFKGEISKSANSLYACLDLIFEIKKELVKLYAYAHMSYDEDTRESNTLSNQQEAAQLFVDFESTVAFVTPEILTIKESTLSDFYKENSKLNTYRQYLNDIIRTQAHILSEAEENIIAQAGLMSESASNIYDIFTNADIPREIITLSTEEEITLDSSGFNLYRGVSNREDRKNVFDTYYDSINRFKRTIGTQLYSQLKKNQFYKNVRKYESSLECALDDDNIPTSVYKNLVESANKHLPTLHRYLNLRKRMLGVENLHYYDMYPPLVKDVDLTYDYDSACDTVLKSVEILGGDYCDVVKQCFSERWIDTYPNEGKQSGAYSQGSAYDVHPYILLNYNGKYDDMSTLTHELGHTMHSYLSNKNQEYVNSDYPIFLAEVASTVNEALLIDYVLKNITDKEKRLSLLGSFLEGFRTTLFRQTQFAEFELKINEIAESGKSLTGDQFNEIYLDILKKYYGHNEGITTIDERYAAEWAVIPHFYYNFYVFQYSTSFVASQAISEKLLTEGAPMVDNYLKFLSSGCSEYAIPTLEKVGVNMNSIKPFDLTIEKMNKIMDEIEKLL